jgi:ribulose-phosphate 3-epimerase
VIKAIRNYSKITFDAHLMIEDPIRYIDAFADAGCDMITVHCEAKGDIHGAIAKIKERGLKAGISINPETEVTALEEFLPEVELVLVMTVHPGFGGQSFISDCVPKISWVKEWAKKNGKEILVSVDGGVNDKTSKICTDAGADILVAGSYLFKMKDMAPTIAEWHRS